MGIIDLHLIPPFINELIVGDACFLLVGTPPNTLTHLTLGNQFDKEITIPNGLTHLTFGKIFNNPVTLPDTVKFLTFGRAFNRPITVPSSTLHLTFGDSFNQAITLPNTLQILKFGMHFNQSIVIPSSVVRLTFGAFFNYPLILSPVNSITHLKLGQFFDQPIPHRIPHLTHLTVAGNLVRIPPFKSSFSFMHQVIVSNEDTWKKIPATTTHLTTVIDPHSKLWHFIPETLQSFELTIETISNLTLNKLPPSLTHLSVSSSFYHSIEFLPSSVTHLTLGNSFNRTLDDLPPHLLHLSLGEMFNQPISHLPPIQYLKLGSAFQQNLQPPASLTELDITMIISGAVTQQSRFFSLAHVQTLSIRLGTMYHEERAVLVFSPWKRKLEVIQGGIY